MKRAAVHWMNIVLAVLFSSCTTEVIYCTLQVVKIGEAVDTILDPTKEHPQECYAMYPDTLDR